MTKLSRFLTLMQTGKARIIPIVSARPARCTYWETWLRFLTEHLFKLGLVSLEDFSFFKIAHDVDEAERRDPPVLQSLSLRALGRGTAGFTHLPAVIERTRSPILTRISQTFFGRARLFRERVATRKNEPEIWNLARLILTPYRNNFGRFPSLIDAMNASSVG